MKSQLQTQEKINTHLLFAKKTKIVGTIGPATENEEMLTSLVEAGLNVVRLNFSHGSYEEHQPRVEGARRVSEKLGVPIAVLQDLSGPKIRIGVLKGEKVELKAGESFTLTTNPEEGDATRAFVNYNMLPQEVKMGNIILLRDGRVKLEVQKVTGNDIQCKIIQGGEIKSKAGVNVPGAYLTIDCLTEKDRKDILFGIQNKVDFMAISFVRRADDVRELKEILAKAKADIKVIAKIETQEAIENIDEIIEESYGIMVARGDLASEVPSEEVPVLQKMIVRKCNKHGKPVIVATQMLESMISSSVPTRAEVNDIANAILDGADAVMLSEETTLGKFPLEAVRMMTRVAKYTEKNYPHADFLKREHLEGKESTDSVCYAAANMAHELKAKAIVALSFSGFSARMVSRHRTKQPVLAITPDRITYNRTALKFNSYGIYTSEVFTGISTALDCAKKIAKQTGLVEKNDTIVIVAGIPFSQSGTTNLLSVQKIE